MIEQVGRTIIGSIVFIDIVRYSEAPNSRQLAMKARLNAVIAEAVAALASSERVILDTGDGAAICFLGDPEDALFAATAINEAVRKTEGDAAQEVRIGINLGPVKLITDLNGWANVVGDGVNVAQRVMSFADIGEILVSRSFYEVVARLREGNERLFRYMGSKRDKHVREHQLYAFGLDSGVPVPAQPARAGRDEPSAAEPAEPASGGLAAALLAAEERRLAAYIGPLARVIVRRAAESASSAGELCRAIAEAIPDAADRASFLAAAPVEAAPEAPPAASARAASPPESALPLSAAELESAERRLAQYIGPLAGVLVKKAARMATDRPDFYARLGASIANQADRAAFLATVEA